jgi:N6-L-threonylcarbamoyladenine synthase
MPASLRVLGIESTCDETAAAVVEADADGRGRILSNAVLSQIAEHASFGGVVPEIAARAHVDALDRLIRRALDEAGCGVRDIDAVAAAAGPGLIGGVMVGLTTGKAIALAANKPFIAVNHLEGHALTPRLTEGIEFPYLLLLVSGGHSQLVVVEDVGDYRRLGSTVDDALGEAFDKAAKLLGLPYAGGPRVEEAALTGDPERFDFPRPMAGRRNPDFSFSGLKTAVRQEAVKIAPLSVGDIADLCASFQAAAVDVVVDRCRAALRLLAERPKPPTALVAAGGVAANGAIRRGLARLCLESGLKLALPPVGLCSDNGAMIAWAGLERFRRGLTDGMDFAARPRWPLDSRQDPRWRGKA